MWIMGTSITLSMRSLLKKGASRLSLALKVLRRTIILFGLGLILNTIDSGSENNKLSYYELILNETVLVNLV